MGSGQRKALGLEKTLGNAEDRKESGRKAMGCTCWAASVSEEDEAGWG